MDMKSFGVIAAAALAAIVNAQPAQAQYGAQPACPINIVIVNQSGPGETLTATVPPWVARPCQTILLLDPVLYLPTPAPAVATVITVTNIGTHTAKVRVQDDTSIARTVLDRGPSIALAPGDTLRLLNAPTQSLGVWWVQR